MSPGAYIRLAATAAAAAALAGSLLAPATAAAQPIDPAEPADPTLTDVAPPPAGPQAGQPGDNILHNVVYRARFDGTSRRAVVAYKMDDQNVNSATPNLLLPGQTFEVNAVLDDPKLAGMEISIDWPYGSNLHCEILVDDQVVAQADQFIAPRLFRPKDDPLYGTLQCGAPLDIPVPGLAPLPDTATDAAPAEPAPTT
ncbi:Uncharacterised protein [Mycolicibacterium phlei]|uniref:Uncharacterized protein n=1 Tax=Mycolicibacterium phlei DSM 43239 = CCUG 21000 TaxID=1226750 RepID=A0A5N5V6S5_MYCPH|nr:hypothetical protein [Mycolicibacterium phlei]VEG09671.1 Uncharacterised protein [Mycobacteroides chelonae]AMO61563.1 hypothetical protein MPHLCCUG_02752 [Mycolicibacterium phlei]KAB7757615.1 hypothetical protein MPHL21000_07460 [Mycolicibacterium phlei DSM 43239 = CCUG 21000]KXW67811.1 hypothetical protein MPHL43239_04745 [Mycolicibacterium phlei DSM 43239 = CCUG 21000]KXW70669.1 hypothetical protein MPHL43072_18020 [Mycolicibacterium phlei DSM 43072]